MSRCTSCGAEIFWARTINGVSMPLDINERPDGNVVIEKDLFGKEIARVVVAGKGTYVSHFATCPHADLHRRS
jgi:hypothetical protein